MLVEVLLFLALGLSWRPRKSGLVPSLLLSFVQTSRADNVLGFAYWNYDRTSYSQEVYETEFSVAQHLPGTSGWNTAQLYTPLAPDGSGLSPAIAAAVATKTKLLIMICAFAANDSCDVTPELNAIQQAATTYGSSFTSLLVGISVQDQAISYYRNDPTKVAGTISQVKSALSKTSMSAVPVGTRDKPEGWLDSSMQPVIAACDFVFLRLYPMIYNTTVNINAGISFSENKLAAVQNVTNGKAVWVSTGWPTMQNVNISFALTPSLGDAQTYWSSFGCGNLFETVNTFWGSVEPSPYGDDILRSDNVPLFDLSCAGTSNSTTSSPSSSSSASSAAATPTQSSSAAQAAGPDSSTKLGLGIGLGVALPVLAVLIAFLVVSRSRSNHGQGDNEKGTPPMQLPTTQQYGAVSDFQAKELPSPEAKELSGLDVKELPATPDSNSFEKSDPVPFLDGLAVAGLPTQDKSTS